MLRIFKSYFFSVGFFSRCIYIWDIRYIYIYIYMHVKMKTAVNVSRQGKISMVEPLIHNSLPVVSCKDGWCIEFWFQRLLREGKLVIFVPSPFSFCSCPKRVNWYKFIQQAKIKNTFAMFLASVGKISLHLILNTYR